MDEVDVLGEPLDSFWDVFSAGCECALAEANAVAGTGNQIAHLLKVFRVVCDLRHTPEHGHWGVIWVERQLYARLLAHRDDSLEECSQCFPQCFGGGNVSGAHLTMYFEQRLGVVVGRDQSPTAFLLGDGGAGPVARLHPVVAEDLYA